MADAQPNQQLLVDGYLKLRAKKKEIEDRHKAELAPINAMMDKLDLIFLSELNKAGSESVRTNAGTFFKVKKVSVTVASSETYLEWLQRTGQWELADIRAAKTNIVAYKESTVTKENPSGEIPPGLNYREEVGINIRKAAGSGKTNNGTQSRSNGGDDSEAASGVDQDHAAQDV